MRKVFVATLIVCGLMAVISFGFQDNGILTTHSDQVGGLVVPQSPLAMVSTWTAEKEQTTKSAGSAVFVSSQAKPVEGKTAGQCEEFTMTPTIWLKTEGRANASNLVAMAHSFQAESASC